MAKQGGISRRMPRYLTYFNRADDIGRYLQEDGHRVWGCIIYRCTYENDDDWDDFTKHLNYRSRRTMAFYNSLDMMDSLSMTIFEDK